jgi:ankyrin repeat protein
MAELIDAVRCGDTAEVRRLIADGADSNQLDMHDRTALLEASIYSRVEIATVLL